MNTGLLQALVELTKNQFALIDEQDYEWLSQYNWYYSSTGYACRDQRIDGKKYCILMHRFITDAQLGFDVDHINRNKLDNRRSNLRIVSRQENMRNLVKQKKKCSSSYIGVSLAKQLGKWESSITVNNKRKILGYFSSEIEAAIAYNIEAERLGFLTRNEV